MRRSAGVPWRSPLVSFLKAYVTEMGRPPRYCPFIASIAASDASKSSKLMNPKPLEVPDSGSRITFGLLTTTPKALKVLYSSVSSTSGSKFPMNRLAPTSWAALSWVALLTRRGFPKSLIMFRILIAYAASSSDLNSTKP